MTRAWRPYAEAKAFVHHLGLKSQKEWRNYCCSGQRPADIPSSPNQVYGEAFEGTAAWLGSETYSTRNRAFLPFVPARTFVRSLKLKNATEWRTYCKSTERPSFIPTHPQDIYREEFQGLGDWLGSETISNRDRDYLPFRDARTFVHSLTIKSRKEWITYCTSGSKPHALPSHPDNVYQEFTTWGDWLGTGRIATIHRSYRSYQDARAFVHVCGLKNWKEWRAYCKTEAKPADIPTNPARTYGSEFQGLGDWLCTGFVATTRRPYRSYKEARDFVHRLGLKSQQEWREYCATGQKPADIPMSPQEVYDGDFRGWCDWLQIEGKWTKKRLLALLEDLRPQLEHLTEQELYVILQRSGALPVLTLALGKKLPIHALQTLLQQEEQDHDFISSLDDLSDEMHLSDKKQVKEDGDLEEEQQEMSLALFDPEVSSLPPLSQRSLQSVDALASICDVLDTEAVEYLVTNRVSQLWDLYTHAGRDAVEVLLAGSGGAFFNEIKQRFLAEVDAVEQLPIPEGWSFADQEGRVIDANPMQRRTAWQVLVRKRVGNWSGSGAGKTLSAVLASRICDAQMTLVVTNLATIEGWQEQIMQSYPDSVVHTEVDHIVPKRKDHQYLLLNYEKFQGILRDDLVKALLTLSIDFIVLDEVHFAKQRDAHVSKRRKSLLALLQGATEQNNHLRVLAMSATPVINTLAEAKALLELITGRTFPDLDTKATVNNALAMHRTLMQYGFRYRPRYEQEVHIELLPTVCNELLPSLQEAQQSILHIEQTLLPPKLEIMRPYLEKGTLIYTHYVQDIITTIQRHLLTMGYTVGLYTGDEKSGLDRFLKGKTDILLASRPILTGVDGLQKVCHRMILLSLPWTGAEYEQLLGRTHRQGSIFGEMQVLVPQVVLADDQGSTWSWDQVRWSLIHDKRTLSDCAVDGYIPERVRMNEQFVFHKSCQSLEEWISRVKQDGGEEPCCA